MSPIGGFLPLELGRCGEAWHPAAAALCSGRACWHAILLASRPRRVHLPFYVCDAMLQPLTATGTPYEFYRIDETFRPILDEAPGADELVVVVNYFGVQTPLVEEWQTAHGNRVAIDDTQAFFRRGLAGSWSFNSARKFFGVPDGAYLYGPSPTAHFLPPNDETDCGYLLARLAGHDAVAWQGFQEHEARIGIEPRGISRISARLLAATDYGEALRRRRANFLALHLRLRSLNTIAVALDDVEGGPLCYPFLPSRPIDRSLIRGRGLFVPIFWPELDGRTGQAFQWERETARRMLPLPIDQRYGPSEMETVADTIFQVLA